VSDVIRRVRRADPVAGATRLFLNQETLREIIEERREGVRTQVVDLSSPTAAARRPRWSAAVAAFFTVLALGAVSILVAELTERESTAAGENLAVMTVKDFFRNLTEGDAATALDLMHPDLLEDEQWIRPGLEFLAALPGAKTVEECTSEPDEDWIRVSCSITFSGPLFVATDQETKLGTMTVDESGLFTSRPALGPRTAVDRAFIEYATTVEPAGFAEVCGTDAYEAGTVQTGTGYSWTGACGEFWASLADDAASWVAAGKPPLSEAGAKAVQTAEGFLSALSRGDTRAALELMHSDVQEAPTLEPLLEFVAALPGSKYISDCTTSDGPRGVTALCEIEFDGPLFQAMAQTTATGSFLVRDGMIVQPPDLGRRPDVDNVFVEYASQVEPELFDEACSSDSYEPGEVRVDTDGYVFAGPCGELWARLTDDMASWLTQGKPPLDGEAAR
jgi:ketosteroid isomerase-like protein